jgi:hypothetical protein
MIYVNNEMGTLMIINIYNFRLENSSVKHIGYVNT